MGKRRRTHDPPSRAGQAPAHDGLAKDNPIDDEPSVSTSSSDDGESSDSGSEPIVSDGGGSDSSPEEDAFDEIDVNFQFFDPRESDFHGLRALLHTYVQDGEFDAGSLADTIIAQPSVGTVVRTGEEEDPIAVMTALNTVTHAAAPWARQVRAQLLAKCSQPAERDSLAKAWDSPGTGLIINERLINCPPQLAPPLLQALLDEVAWATEDEPTQERRNAFKFKRFILLTRVYSDPLPAGDDSAGPSSSTQQQQQKQQKQQKGAGSMQPPPPRKRSKPAGPAAAGEPVLVYVRPEDEFLHRAASVSFTFPVEGRAVGRDELTPLRLALLLPAEAAVAARASLDAVIGNMAAAGT